jgi:hypothetical protein
MTRRDQQHDEAKEHRQYIERRHAAAREQETRLDEATIAAGQLAIRMAILINGGAAVAVLAFVGGLVGHEQVKLSHLVRVAGSLQLFAWGVVAAGAALGLFYCTNYCHTRLWQSYRLIVDPPYIQEGDKSKSWRWGGHFFHVTAVIAGLLSLGFFIWGVIAVYRSIKYLGVPVV